MKLTDVSSPGTGKTVVMIEAMSQILRKYSKSRLLACAPSNSASDLVAQRLQQQGFTPSEMFRLNAPSRKFKTSKKVSGVIPARSKDNLLCLNFESSPNTTSSSRLAFQLPFCMVSA